MRRFLFLAPLILAAAPHAEPVIPDFTPSDARFADAAACRNEIARLLADARAAGSDAAEGPYDFEAGDVRGHSVRAEGGGHRIAEYRCLAERLGLRSWAHSMGAPEQEFTIESVARGAPWLEHP